MDEVYEYHETINRQILAFHGQSGMGGVFVYRKKLDGTGGPGWDFLPSGHPAWDRHHQEVYKNGRSDQLKLEQLAEMGIPVPTAEERINSPTVKAWRNSPGDRMPLSEVPDHLQSEFTEENRRLYVVMKDDKGEWMYDGRQLFPSSVYWQESDAREYAQRMEDDRYLYTVKEIPVRVDKDNEQLVAELSLGAFEHANLKEVLGLFPAPPYNPYARNKPASGSQRGEDRGLLKRVWDYLWRS